MSREKALKGYERKDYLGSGSFGEVWKGLHTESGRDVAIKMLSRRRAIHPGCLQDREERLQILCVNLLSQEDLEVDEDFYVISPLMKASVHSRAGQAYNDPMKAMRWFEDTAKAVAAAHKKGWVHGHLKPTNILLAENDEIRVADLGQVPVVEFYRTNPDEVWYVAPEMAAAGSKPNPSWDIYALGAVFYHILTGTPPRSTDAANQALAKLKRPAELWAKYAEMLPELPLTPLVKHNPKVPIKFADLIENCLELDPEKRPQDIASILVWIERVIHGIPEKKDPNAPKPLGQRIFEWMMASKARAAALIGVVVLGMAGIGVLISLKQANRRQAEQYFESGKQAEGQAAVLYYLQAAQLVPDERKYRDAIAKIMAERPSLVFYRELGHANPGDFGLLSPTGTYALIAGKKPSLFKDHTEMPFIAGGGEITAAAFSPDGKYVFASGPLETRLWDLEKKDVATTFKLKAPADYVAYSSDGKTVVTASGHSVTIWDAATGKPVQQVGVKGKVVALSQRTVASLKNDVIVSDFNGKTLRIVPGGSNEFKLVKFSPKGDRLITSDANKAVLWEVGAPFMKPLNAPATDTGFGAGNNVVVVDSSGRAREWNTESGTPTTPAAIHPDGIVSVALSSDEQWALVQTSSGFWMGRAAPLVEPEPDGADWDEPIDLLEAECQLYSNALFAGGTMTQLTPEKFRWLKARWDQLGRDHSRKCNVPAANAWLRLRTPPAAASSETPKPAQTPDSGEGGSPTPDATPKENPSPKAE
ncbi:MAG: protein kinase [Candidatus Eremiobacteraeota bacterium]|nr:protein kinase [Candidatus Eremiobacteraeota bacterium]